MCFFLLPLLVKQGITNLFLSFGQWLTKIEVLSVPLLWSNLRSTPTAK
jgi:hypothetical protein